MGYVRPRVRLGLRFSGSLDEAPILGRALRGRQYEAWGRHPTLRSSPQRTAETNERKSPAGSGARDQARDYCRASPESQSCRGQEPARASVMGSGASRLGAGAIAARRPVWSNSVRVHLVRSVIVHCGIGLSLASRQSHGFEHERVEVLRGQAEVAARRHGVRIYLRVRARPVEEVDHVCPGSGLAGCRCRRRHRTLVIPSSDLVNDRSSGDWDRSRRQNPDAQWPSENS